MFYLPDKTQYEQLQFFGPEKGPWFSDFFLHSHRMARRRRRFVGGGEVSKFCGLHTLSMVHTRLPAINSLTKGRICLLGGLGGFANR